MQVSADLPLSAEKVPALSHPAQRVQRQLLDREYTGDEEFPADLPVEYDRLLQPASGRSFRRAVSVSAATLAVLLCGLSLWGVHRFPKLTLALGIVLSIVVIAAACRVAFSALVSARSKPAWHDLPHQTFHLKI
jgi:hypothetical protein